MTTPGETATRAAIVMSSAMNLNVTLLNGPLLAAADPAELKRTLAWVAGEAQWLLSIAASLDGLALPPDTESRAGSLHALCEANPDLPLTPEEVGVALNFLAVLQPS
jgi:hypothetical protein